APPRPPSFPTRRSSDLDLAAHPGCQGHQPGRRARAQCGRGPEVGRQGQAQVPEPLDPDPTHPQGHDPEGGLTMSRRQGPGGRGTGNAATGKAATGNAATRSVLDQLAAEADAMSLSVEGHTRSLTSLGRTLWPEAGPGGLTKRDLLRYFVQVAPQLLDHVRGRPVFVTRFPGGIDGQSFYQKVWERR